ncbi:MAG: prepilin-type N-terminal cleavage/methylation domain-containing protein [Myxococcota bacterium]
MNPRPLRRPQLGLTLIEITIGLAIAAMVMSVGVTSINALTDAHLRSAAVEITGAVKYSYDRSIMEKRIQRIGFDLDRHVWWLEYTSDAYGLNAELTRGEEGAKRDDDGNIIRNDDDDQFDFDSDTDADVKKALEGGKAASFQPDGSDKPRALQGDVTFDSVWTGHQEEPFTSGIAYLHFFRGGWTEPAQIVLTDGESFTTLKVSPLTGRVRSYKRKLEDGKGEAFDASEEGGRL